MTDTDTITKLCAIIMDLQATNAKATQDATWALSCKNKDRHQRYKIALEYVRRDCGDANRRAREAVHSVSEEQK